MTEESFRLAYDEVCVLLDCMTLAYVDKQLMSLEVGHNYSINYEERPFELSDKALGMVLKKKVNLPRALHAEFRTSLFSSTSSCTLAEH